MHEWYERVKKRRDGSTIYKNQEQWLFLKQWPKDVVHHEMKIYSLLYPFIKVPKVIIYEESADAATMVEESLWDKVWKDIFKENMNENWIIWDDLISQVFDQVQKFMESTYTMKSDRMWWFDTWMNPFEMILTEKWTESDICDVWKLGEYIKSILDNLEIVWCHGDFNVYNLAPNWVFDFEDSHMGYYWYDLFSFLTHIFWFPMWNITERSRSYTFSRQQIEQCLKQCSKYQNFLDPKVFGSLFLYRWAWACVKMQERPQLAKYRYYNFLRYWREFLEWESIMEKVLDEFNNDWKGL